MDRWDGPLRNSFHRIPFYETLNKKNWGYHVGYLWLELSDTSQFSVFSCHNWYHLWNSWNSGQNQSPSSSWDGFHSQCPEYRLYCRRGERLDHVSGCRNSKHGLNCFTCTRHCFRGSCNCGSIMKAATARSSSSHDTFITTCSAIRNTKLMIQPAWRLPFYPAHWGHFQLQRQQTWVLSWARLWWHRWLYPQQAQWQLSIVKPGTCGR